jgi:hypothetical protein
MGKKPSGKDETGTGTGGNQHHAHKRSFTSNNGNGGFSSRKSFNTSRPDAFSSGGLESKGFGAHKVGHGKGNDKTSGHNNITGHSRNGGNQKDSSLKGAHGSKDKNKDDKNDKHHKHHSETSNSDSKF